MLVNNASLQERSDSKMTTLCIQFYTNKIKISFVTNITNKISKQTILENMANKVVLNKIYNQIILE